MKPVFLVFIASFLAAFAQFFYKLGVDFSLPFFIGFFLYCATGLLIVFSLKFLEMSVVFPVLSLSFVWTVLISIFYFKEVVSLFNWFGVGLIVIGIWLVSR